MRIFVILMLLLCSSAVAGQTFGEYLQEQQEEARMKERLNQLEYEREQDRNSRRFDEELRQQQEEHRMQQMEERIRENERRIEEIKLYGD